jgi:hypothetical protein
VALPTKSGFLPSVGMTCKKEFANLAMCRNLRCVGRTNCVKWLPVGLFSVWDVE